LDDPLSANLQRFSPSFIAQSSPLLDCPTVKWLNYVPTPRSSVPPADPGDGPTCADAMPPKSDRELVDAARGGDTDAFGVLVRRYQKRIYRLAVHCSAIRPRPKTSPRTPSFALMAHSIASMVEASPSPWMYRIAVNLSLNAIRSRKNNRRAPLPPTTLGSRAF
jgi:hypothetical protein